MTTTRSPILFPNEVHAALDDRLGLVVRPVKGYRTNGTVEFQGWHQQEHCDALMLWEAGDGYGYKQYTVRCPLGVPGTRLVCKETYCFKRLSHIPKTHTEAKCSEGPCYRCVTGGLFCHRDVGRDGTGSPLWMSPATMPAWASRITLEVEIVRVCRLGDITETDANMAGDLDDLEPADVCATAKRYGLAMDDGRASFACSWDARYAAKGFWWDANPWVWACGVGRVEG